MAFRFRSYKILIEAELNRDGFALRCEPATSIYTLAFPTAAPSSAPNLQGIKRSNHDITQNIDLNLKNGIKVYSFGSELIVVNLVLARNSISLTALPFHRLCLHVSLTRMERSLKI